MTEEEGPQRGGRSVPGRHRRGRNDGSETAWAELDEICDSVMKQLYVSVCRPERRGAEAEEEGRHRRDEDHKLEALASQLGLELVTVRQKFGNKRSEMNAYLKAQCKEAGTR